MSDVLQEARPTQLAELHRQVQVLVDKGYPKAARLSQRAFRSLAAPLEDLLTSDSFVLVVSAALVAPQEQIARTALNGKPGFTTMEPADLAAWQPTDQVAVPTAPLWLIEDVDTGSATLSVRPDDALPGILAAGRSPLTLEEGLAVATQHPEWLKERNCFEMLGSRAGDKRVTGVWVSAGRPRLGWCWGGNPHTWLGMASCAGRIAAAS